jgi:hypothetical protein
VSGWDRVGSGWSTAGSGLQSVSANCVGNRVVVGGGFDTSGVDDPSDIVILRSGPNSNNDAWVVEARSLGEGFQIAAIAICARVN